MCDAMQYQYSMPYRHVTEDHSELFLFISHELWSLENKRWRTMIAGKRLNQ